MLFESADHNTWDATLALYDKALQSHVSNKKDDSLIALDAWYQSTLPALLAKRAPQYITSSELVQLMSWKLKRGKFRPSLAKLAASNSDADVRAISEEAFKLVNSGLKSAITKMAELKGVGPATASAILCAGAPSKVPFMADETMSSVPGLGAIAYTIPYYLKFATKVIEKAAQLGAIPGAKVNSPHHVEMALWTDYMLERYVISRDNVPDTTLSKKDLGFEGKKATDKAPAPAPSKSSTSKRKTEPPSEPDSQDNNAGTAKKSRTRTSTRSQSRV